MAWTEEINKGRLERRQILTLEVTPEPVCFPHAEQAAQLFRQIGKGKPEIVWLLNRNGIWVPGLFRRLAVSLFAEWKSQSPKRKYATLTDFHAQMGAEYAAFAMRFVSARCPKFSRGS